MEAVYNDLYINEMNGAKRIKFIGNSIWFYICNRHNVRDKGKGASLIADSLDGHLLNELNILLCIK